MSRPFFFAGTQPNQSSSQYLISFKAGRLNQSGTTVTPVKDKKGLIYLHQSTEDQLMHFCWKDRTTGQVDEDLIIFPDDAEFLRIPQCTTGRAFVLKFKTSPRRLFFWSQEAKTDKDEEYVTKINEYFNNPPPVRERGAAIDLDDDVRNLLTNDVGTQQLMQMLGSVRNTNALANLLSTYTGSGQSSMRNSTSAAPQTPTSTPAVGGSANSSASSGKSTEPSQLQARLQEVQAKASGSENRVVVDLSTSVNIELLQPLLTNEDFLKRVRETLPKTGAPTGTTQELAKEVDATIRSAQFQQALSSFSAAFESAQLGPVIQQFGLGPDAVAAANTGNMEMFLKALKDAKKKPEDAAKTGEAKAESGKVTPKKDDKNPDKKSDGGGSPMALD